MSEADDCTLSAGCYGSAHGRCSTTCRAYSPAAKPSTRPEASPLPSTVAPGRVRSSTSNACPDYDGPEGGLGCAGCSREAVCMDRFAKRGTNTHRHLAPAGGLRERLVEIFDRAQHRPAGAPWSNSWFADRALEAVREAGWLPPEEIADPCDTCGGRRLVYDGGDSDEQDECPDCTVVGLRRSRDQADAWSRQLEAESITKAELIEQACAGAVVGRLWREVSLAAGKDCPYGLTLPPVPIASVGPFGWLAEAVGERLLSGRLGCEGMCCGGSGYRDGEPVVRCELPPPFAAVRSELIIDGERWVEWTLMSAACEGCEGVGSFVSNHPGYAEAIQTPCEDCDGSGARTDAEAIANRYHDPPTERTLALYVSRCCGQPLIAPRPNSIECSECGTMAQPGNCVPVWAADNTARVARFRVRASGWLG